MTMTMTMIRTRRQEVLAALIATLLIPSFCDGFVLQKNSINNDHHHHHHFEAAVDTRLHATIQQPTSFKTLTEFNQQLQRMSEKSSVTTEPVIIRAAECEELWENQCHYHQDEVVGESTTSPESPSFQPDTNSFNTVLEAWSHCVKTLVRYENENDDAVPPNVLEMAGTTSLPPSAADVYTPFDAAKHATSLLVDYAKPDLTSYNLVLDIWTNSKADEAPEYAERTFRMMKSKNVEPDLSTYNLLIGCWAESGRGVDKALQIYRHMKKRSQRGTNDDDGAHEGTAQVPAPSIRTVNSVLHAHSKQAAKCIAANYKSKNGYNEALQLAEQADSIFKEAKNCGGEEFSPDLTTYTSLIDCYGRCGKYATALRCESLLDELKVLYKETSSLRYKPNFKTYTAVITAWSRVAARVPDAPRRVEALLDEMRQEDETYPNAQSYTAAIRCYARSKAKDKAKKALQVLMSMREEEKKGRSASRPTTRTYDAAIDCCSKALHEPTESIKIAFAILKTIELDENTTPSSTTYRSLISTVSLLPPSPERNQLAASVFNKAKNASCCSLDVVKTLRTCVDTDTMRECLEGRLDATGHFNYDQLPRSWSKNIA